VLRGKHKKCCVPGRSQARSQQTSAILSAPSLGGFRQPSTQLEVEQAAIRFTHDEWMRSLYGDDPPETQFSVYAKRVSGVMETVWTRCRKAVRVLTACFQWTASNTR
jgi:hypothetical protein